MVDIFILTLVGSTPPWWRHAPRALSLWVAPEVGVRREREKVEEHATCVLLGRGRKAAATATQARPRTMVRMVIKEGNTSSHWYNLAAAITATSAAVPAII